MKNNIKKYKFSRQREKILDILRKTDKHPTADWIYDEIKKEFPNISMGTVYRNLKVLIEMGLVNKLDFGSTFDRFEINEDQHYHFICKNCGNIIDIEIPSETDIEIEIQEKYNLVIQSHRVEFYGICKDCMDKTSH